LDKRAAPLHRLGGQVDFFAFLFCFLKFCLFLNSLNSGFRLYAMRALGIAVKSPEPLRGGTLDSENLIKKAKINCPKDSFGGARTCNGKPDPGFYRPRGTPKTMCECADVRMCGYADVRMCGYADVRMCRYADVRIWEYADVGRLLIR
jgi:hypothetical protein